MVVLFGEPVECETCGEKYPYDQVMGYGCLTLIDSRTAPSKVLCAWCNEDCLALWMEKSDNPIVIPTM